MEIYHLKEIAERNSKAAEFIDRFIDDEFIIDDMDEYERELNQELIGRESFGPNEMHDYWLALFYCRALKQEFNEETLDALSLMTKVNKLDEQLGDGYADITADLFELLKKILANSGFKSLYEARKERTSGNKKWTAGDQFSIQMENGKYILGRILLKISDCLTGKKANARTNGLVGSKSGFLVEVYEGVHSEKFVIESKVIIPGVIIYPDALTNGFYEKIGSAPVMSSEIDFPEIIIDGFDEGVRFMLLKGELQLPLSNDDEIYGIKTDWSSSIQDGYWLDQSALMVMGRTEELVVQNNHYNLSLHDLRLGNPESRKIVYAGAGLKLGTSYLDMLATHGYDTGNYY